jgi:hypothetical protein
VIIFGDKGFKEATKEKKKPLTLFLLKRNNGNFKEGGSNMLFP